MIRECPTSAIEETWGEGTKPSSRKRPPEGKKTGGSGEIKLKKKTPACRAKEESYLTSHQTEIG